MQIETYKSKKYTAENTSRKIQIGNTGRKTKIAKYTLDNTNRTNTNPKKHTGKNRIRQNRIIQIGKSKSKRMNNISGNTTWKIEFGKYYRKIKIEKANRKIRVGR